MLTNKQQQQLTTRNSHITKQQAKHTITMSPLPLTSGVSHVGLAVSDIDASLAFFQAVGFEKVGGSESYPSYFVTDGTSLITLWQTDDNATPFNRRSNVGLHHLAIRVPTVQALQEIYHIVGLIKGVRIDGEGAFAPQKLDGTPLTHTIVYEPSGNRIEFTHHEESTPTEG